MTEVEKQESQKTVVAFITGLLIGGLLVWVFSSTPETAQVEKKEITTDTTETVTKDESKIISATELKSENRPEKKVTGNGLIIVNNQSAGQIVTLDTIETPTNVGWVVVRDYMDGVPGNILGAARYSVEEGLFPVQVELIRETTAGSSYQVVFFTNEGGQDFSLVDDTLIEGASTTFKAN